MNRISYLLLVLLISGCAAGQTDIDPGINIQPTIDPPQVMKTKPAGLEIIATNSVVPTSLPAVSETPVEKKYTQEADKKSFEPEPNPPPLMSSVNPLEPAAGMLGYLSQPAAVMRNGITLTVHQLFMYGDRIELLYTVQDLPQSFKFDDFNDEEIFRCAGPMSYPTLEIVDGKKVRAAPVMLDGRAFDLYDPLVRYYAAHIFYERIPRGTEKITFLLYCLGPARIDKAPLDWRIPLEIVW